MPGAAFTLKWYLFLIAINLTSPMDRTNTQAIKSYADNDRVTCETEGAAMVAILNNPLHRAQGAQMIVYTCINFVGP